MGKQGKPYKPYSAEEGIVFEDRFCNQCKRDQKYFETMDGADSCDIHNRGQCFLSSDEDFPPEWSYDENEKPTCTAFEKIKEPAKSRHNGEIYKKALTKAIQEVEQPKTFKINKQRLLKNMINLNEEVGSMIRRKRIDLGFSYRKANNLYGFDDICTLGEIERGETPVPSDKIQKIAEVLSFPELIELMG